MANGTINTFGILQQASSYQDAYNKAKSILAINAQDTSGNNWVIYIPKALISTTARVWGCGDFHSTTDFNNFTVTITTTSCTAVRVWRGQYPQSDAITYWYM